MPKSPCDRLVRRPIAHRGLHDLEKGVIENTPGAFARALDGDFAIECDLQVSEDGEAMVFHDATLDRLTKSVGPVKALTAQELVKVAFSDTSDKMQTLAELLDQVNGKVPLLIEVKSLQDDSVVLVERAIELLSAYQGEFAIMSFDPFLVNHTRLVAPDMFRGAVIMPETEEHWTCGISGSMSVRRVIDQIAPDFISYDVRGLPSDLVENFRKTGSPAICWTVRDQKTAQFAYKFCDQITFEGFLPK